MNRTLIGIGALLAMTACGGGDPAPKTDAPAGGSAPKQEAPKTDDAKSSAPAAKAGKQDWADSMGTATVSGRIAFEGTAPTMNPIDMSSDAVCAASGELKEEHVVVNDGGLANVVISVSKGLDGYKFGKAEGSVEVDQHGCRYVPHVVAMQAGQSLTIKNSDDTVHNVHSYSKRNQAFNQAQPAGAPAIEKQMSQKDKLFAIKCDMHAWMNCNVAVFDHPFFAVSDSKGNFTLPKLPAGTYTLTAEHATLGKQTTDVTVTDGGSATASFTFKQ